MVAYFNSFCNEWMMSNLLDLCLPLEVLAEDTKAL